MSFSNFKNEDNKVVLAMDLKNEEKNSMREIKFRVRLKATEDFGSMKKGEILTMVASVFDKRNGLAFWPLDKVWEFLTADEYTGLKDKNKKEVYEGDILCWPQFEGTKNQTRWIIEWNYERGAWSDYSPREDAEIIGNIYSTPELLK